MTPRERIAGSRPSRNQRAPRSLNDAVNCWFSHLHQTSAPVIADSVVEYVHGVRITAPSMAAAASSTSLTVTAVLTTGSLAWPAGEVGRYRQRVLEHTEGAATAWP